MICVAIRTKPPADHKPVEYLLPIVIPSLPEWNRRVFLSQRDPGIAA